MTWIGKRTPSYAALLLCAGCAAGGALLDFLCNGVFRIIWAVIYVPIYLGAVHLLLLRLSSAPEGSVRRRSTRAAAASLLVGAAIGHWIAVGHVRSVTYFMSLASDSPNVVLQSTEWPQKLIIQTEKTGNLAQQIRTLTSREHVPVKIRLVSDYGCTRSSVIETIANVNIEKDGDTSWTWRAGSEDLDAEKFESGPGSEDQRLPWCHFRFY